MGISTFGTWHDAGGFASRWDIIMFAGHGKIVGCLHDMSVEAFRNFSHFHVQLPGQTVERDQVSRLKQLVSQCPSNVRVMVESE